MKIDERWPPDRLERLIFLKGQEKTDAECAKELGTNADEIFVIRKRHGIPGLRPETNRPRSKAAFIRSRGWPICLPLRCVQIVEHLCDYGPATISDLTTTLGLPKRARAKGSKSFLSLLEREGLIHVLPDTVPRPVKGPGRSLHLYFPSSLALSIRQEFLQGRKNGTE